MKTYNNRRVRRAVIALAGVLLIAIVGACDSDSGDETPSATASASSSSTPASSETPTASTTPAGGSATPTPGSTDGEVLTGTFQTGFEQSGFYPNTICPDDGPAYWVAWEDFDFGAALEAATGTAPFGVRQPTTYRVSIEGQLSEPGSYGHLGLYERELTVTGLVSAELAEECDEPGTVTTDPVESEGFARYEAARALWESAEAEDYEFTLQRNCFCPPEFRGPFTITVVDGAVIQALYEGAPAEDGVAITVEEVFDRIEQALRRGVLTELSYDPNDGHPVTVRLDLSAIAADGGFSVDLADLVEID